MPVLIIGVAVLATFLLTRKTPEQLKKEAVDKTTADLLAKGQAINAQVQAQKDKDLATGLSIGGTAVGVASGIVAKFLGGGAVTGGGAAAAGGGGAAAAGGGGAAAAGGGGAAGTGSSVATSAGTTAATAGGVAGGIGAATVAGAALAAFCAIAVFACIGFAISNTLTSLLDFPMAAAQGPQAIARGFNASIERTYHKFLDEIYARVPANAWGSYQGYARNLALMMSLVAHRKMNDMYRAGALANAKDIYATQAEHEIFWANHGAFIPDWDAFQETFIQNIGAGSFTSVANAVKATLGGEDAANKALLKAQTLGKFMFYFTAITNKPLFGITDETQQVGWINRFAIANPILQRWPLGMNGSPTVLTGVSLIQAVGAVQPGSGAWNPQDLQALLVDAFEIDNRFHFSGSGFTAVGQYIENGYLMDFGLTQRTGQMVMTDLSDPLQAASNILAFAK